MLAIVLLTLGILSRLMIHIPDFTPVIALSLFGGTYLSKKYALTLPLILLAITDMFLGFHNTMIFTWGSILLISGLGIWLKSHKNAKTIFGASVLSAVIFFLITNLGVWMVSGLYPHTIEGLAECFVMAIPFFRNSFLSTLIYSALFFGAYEVAAARLKQSRFAHVL